MIRLLLLTICLLSMGAVPGGNIAITDWDFSHGETSGPPPRYHEDYLGIDYVVYGVANPESVFVTVTINGHFADFYPLTGYAEDRDYDDDPTLKTTFTQLLRDAYVIDDDPSFTAGEPTTGIPTAETYVVRVECWDLLTGNKFGATKTLGH